MRGRARLVTIDLDPTDDPTHGAQQLSFFSGHYDSWCYLPVMGFVSFNDEAEQYLCAAVLRPGNVTAAVGARGILRRLIQIGSHNTPYAIDDFAQWLRSKYALDVQVLSPMARDRSAWDSRQTVCRRIAL